MHYYTVFGLSVESAIALPAVQLDPHRGQSPADVKIYVCDRLDEMPPDAEAVRSITAPPQRALP